MKPPSILYRGNTFHGMDGLNEGIFRQGLVRTEEYEVVRITEVHEEPERWQATGLEKLPVEYRIQTQHIHGGFTENIGTGIHYATTKHPGQLGGVVYFDTSEIRGSLEPVEYTEDWYAEHPVAAPRTAWMGQVDGVIIHDGRIQGLYRKDGDLRVIERGGQSARDTVISTTLESEDEWVSFDPSVDVGTAMKGVASFYGLGVSPSTPSAVLQEQEGYSRTRHGGVAVRNMDLDEKIEHLHSLEREAMDRSFAEHWTVVLEDRNENANTDEQIPEDNFRLAYDGSRWVEDVRELGYVAGYS